jgi:hypothetical protein
MNGNWEEYPSDWLGCGVMEHGPECLCDVHIDKPTPTVTDWVNHVWMGPQICELRGYGKPWTSAMLADYLTDLSTFHAALKLHGMDNQTGSLGSEVLEEPSFANLMNIRSAVRDFLERMDNPSLGQALYILGVSPQRFFDAATQYKMQESNWDLKRVDEFEEALMRHTKVTEVCERFEMSEGTYYTVKEYFRPVFAHRKVSFVRMASAEQETARKRAIALIAEGHDNASIIRDVESLCGVKYTSAAISKLRVRKFPKSN